MIIGILREEKKPFDSRVVLTPKQCKALCDSFSNVNVVVQTSQHRCFSDKLYKLEGINIVEDISSCDILLGVKEVPVEFLIPNKTYFFFSHTIKKQSYNRDLLKKMVENKIRMIDYEVLKDNYGERILGFGRYAGIIGAYNGFLTYGLKSSLFNLKKASKCLDRKELVSELNNMNLTNEKIIVTGFGRVGKGILEIMKIAGIRKVSINDFLHKKFIEPIFVQLDTVDYNERIDGSLAHKSDFYKYPHLYKSTFMKFVENADIFMAGHYYATGAPFLYTRNDVKDSKFNLKVVADISCDINGPVATTIRPSTIESPIYGYHPVTENEVDFLNDNAIAVMAVSNLPCELPCDSSEDFGSDFSEKILFPMLSGNIEDVISNATICADGNLTANFEYLRNYINKLD